MISTREQKERVQKHFGTDSNWKGGLYDQPHDRFRRAVVRRKTYSLQMLENLDMHGVRVLDVGCGSGAYLQEIFDLGAQCYGMDLALEMAGAARRRLAGTNTNVMCADIESIPMKDGVFDIVLCVGVLGYLVSDTDALKEMHRILKPGGYLLVSVENVMSLSNIDSVLRAHLVSLLSRKKSSNGISVPSVWVYRHSSTHYNYRLYNPWKLEKVMKFSGFTLLDSVTHGFEFRLLRKWKFLPEGFLLGSELFLETMFKKFSLPYFSYSGESYTGLFRKRVAWL